MAFLVRRNRFILLYPLVLFPLVALFVCAGFVGGCTEEQAGDATIRVTIKGKAFNLEPALDNATRVVGLGGRESLAEDGGMIFVFKRAFRQSFYMKDCLIDIDIAYLDDAGRVTAVYTMLEEELQRDGESEIDYVLRLKRYPSRYPSSIAIEVRAGTFADLGLVEGDLIDLDIAGLKARAE